MNELEDLEESAKRAVSIGRRRWKPWARKNGDSPVEKLGTEFSKKAMVCRWSSQSSARLLTKEARDGHCDAIPYGLTIMLVQPKAELQSWRERHRRAYAG